MAICYIINSLSKVSKLSIHFGRIPNDRYAVPKIQNFSYIQNIKKIINLKINFWRLFNVGMQKF